VASRSLSKIPNTKHSFSRLTNYSIQQEDNYGFSTARIKSSTRKKAKKSNSEHNLEDLFVKHLKSTKRKKHEKYNAGRIENNMGNPFCKNNDSKLVKVHTSQGNFFKSKGFQVAKGMRNSNKSDFSKTQSKIGKSIQKLSKISKEKKEGLRQLIANKLKDQEQQIEKIHKAWEHYKNSIIYS